MSELLRRKILESSHGGLLNKLRIGKRRDTLFFNDIFTDYIKTCENAGYGKEMKETGSKWMMLYFMEIVPASIKKLPLFVLGRVMRNVWADGGLMDDFSISEKNGLIEIKTRNEAITKVVGKNEFSVGLFTGICNILFNSEADVISVLQSGSSNTYVFRTRGTKPFRIEHKAKHVYDQLNTLPSLEGSSIVSALRHNLFKLRKNRIYFRDRPLYPVENTLFHLLGNTGILMDKVPEISYNFFKKTVERNSSPKGKLNLLKGLLQAMGWGSVKIMVRKNILFEIRNPPYGIQKEKDNWNFLINSILGYLWLIDKNFKIRKISASRKCVRVTYGR
jgi:hypothetical protein